MKEGLSLIAAVVDRSGSMNSVKADAIGGFNSFLEQQRKLPGEALLSLVLFDHLYELIYNAKPLADIPDLTEKSYQPRGTTALYDAFGRTIDDVGIALAAMPEAERPEKVIICLLTDGMENASKDYSKKRVAEMIKHQQEKYNWSFVFLAANLDAFAEGAALNIAAANTFSFNSKTETKVAFAQADAMTARLRAKPKDKA